ncbi:MAG: N-6 DNA methylase [Bacteroidales bacterium]|nr:N-6 DNA methylase [Bacteroidales bacterium]
MSAYTTPLEQDTRILIDTSLENLGWKLSGHEKNVFMEQPKTESERQLLDGKRPDYVLYSNESDNPLIIIEAKKKGTRLDAALEQGIFYARKLNAPLVFATDGVFCKTFHTGANRPPILNGEEIDEFIRETLALKYLNTYEVNTVSTKVQYDRKELIRIFDEANNMLRGEGLRAGIERFGEFANILFLKLVSESEQAKKESGIKSNFDNACSWDCIKGIPLSTRIDYINKTVYEKLNNLYKTEIFTPLQIKDASILKEIMGKLDPLNLTDVDSDVKGDAFEYFLKASTATKNDLGEYFTPRHIVKTMVRLVNPTIGEKVYDPFCGTGGFLIESFRHIYNNMARTETNYNILKESTIYGNEITNTARITKMNMILAGDGHSNIEMKDSLANPVDGNSTFLDKEGNSHHYGYDIVLANMPYSQRTKHGDLYDISSTNGDSICVQHCIKAINSASPNGRMAIVVPEGFLFRKDLTRTREYLLSHSELQSIISLPQGVFLPYTGVKTDIIYAINVNKKNTSQKKKYFWYFDVKNDGYTLDNHRRKIDTPSDLSKYEEFRKLDSDQKDDMINVGFEIIPIEKVIKNSAILIGAQYRDTKIDGKQLKYDRKSLKDLCTIISGQSPTSNCLNNEGNGLPFHQGSTHFGEYLTNSSNVWTTKVTKRAEKGDLLLSVRAPVGAVNICSQDICIGRGLMALQTYPSIDRKYLFYMLKYKGGHLLQKKSTGSTFEGITRKEVEELQIPIPSIQKQRETTKELDAFLNILLGAKTIIKNYKPQIHYYEDVKMVKVKNLFESISDTITPQSLSGKVTFVGLENIESNTGKIIGDIEKESGQIRSTKRIFKKGDILFGKLRPALNKIAYVDFDGICSTDILVLRPKNDGISSIVYSILMRTREFNELVLNGIEGGQLPRVSVQYLLNLPIQEIPVGEQEKIVEQVLMEQALIEPMEKLINVFSEKIEDCVNEIWKE